MNNKELLNALENLNIDENEFDHINVELNDLEKKRIKKKYKKAIKKKSLFLKRAATIAGLSILLFTGAFYSSPVKASNIPVLNSIYEMLGVYDEYADYSQYIGKSIEVTGGKYTLEEILITPYESLIAIRITGNEPFKEDSLGFMVTSSIGNVHFISATSSFHKIDDYTIIQIIESKYSSKIPEKSIINIDIHEMSSESSPSTFDYGKFELKVDFGKSYDEFSSFPIKQAKLSEYDLKFKEINSSILGTELLGNITTLRNSESEYQEKMNNSYFILNVDGKMYGGFASYSLNTLGKIVFGKASFSFNGIKVNEFKNAENISLSVFKTRYSYEELDKLYESEDAKYINELNESQENKITSNGVSYYKTVNLFNGEKIDFYNLERKNDTVLLHAKISPNEIPLLTKITGRSQDGINIHYPKIYANPEKENEYILEFFNVKENVDFSINNYINYNNEYIFLEELEILNNKK